MGTRESEKDEVENLGVVTKSMHNDGVIYAGHANVEQCNPVAVNSSLEITLSLNGKVKLNLRLREELSYLNSNEMQVDFKSDEIQDHVYSSNEKLANGSRPSSSKPKHKWTRINMMDFGLGGLARVITLPALG